MKGGCFYGWVILGLCGVARLEKAVGQNNVLAVTVPLVLADLGLAAGPFGRTWAGATLMAALAQPAVGIAFDRFGARWCLPLAMVVLAGGLLGLSSASNSVQLFFAGILIRATSIGAIDTCTQGLISLWFRRRRGRATALLSAASAPLSGLLTGVLSIGNEAIGWRSTLVVCTNVLLASSVPMALLTRNRPQDLGVGPDGDELIERRRANQELTGVAPESTELQHTTAAPASSTITAGDTLPTVCSSTLLLLHVTTLYAATVGSGIDLYTVAIAREAGATYDIAAAIFVPLGFITAVCSLIAGWAADQGLAPHKVLSISTLMIALASLSASNLGRLEGALSYAVTRGVWQGFMGNANSLVLPYFFGVTHIGRLSGQQRFAGIFGTTVGMLLVGSLRDLLGSYTSTLIGLAPPAGLLALALWNLPLQQPEAASPRLSSIPGESIPSLAQSKMVPALGSTLNLRDLDEVHEEMESEVAPEPSASSPVEHWSAHTPPSASCATLSGDANGTPSTCQDPVLLRKATRANATRSSTRAAKKKGFVRVDDEAEDIL